MVKYFYIYLVILSFFLANQAIITRVRKGQRIGLVDRWICKKLYQLAYVLTL